jgi:hypothetical protein
MLMLPEEIRNVFYFLLYKSGLHNTESHSMDLFIIHLRYYRKTNTFHYFIHIIKSCYVSSQVLYHLGFHISFNINA